jgi:hypothetical protein
MTMNGMQIILNGKPSPSKSPPLKGINPTNYPQLGYKQLPHHLWTIVNTNTGQPIGPKYTSENDLLQDLDRFADVLQLALSH